MERFVLMNPKIVTKNNIDYPSHSFCFIYYITHPNKSSHFISTSHGKLKVDQIKACLHGGGGPQISEVTRSGSPHLSHKHGQIEKKVYMDRWVTSATWGPPPPCKQALREPLQERTLLIKLFLASCFHVIRQWGMVQNRLVSPVYLCLCLTESRTKKAVFCYSDLSFAACPPSKHNKH